MPALKILDASAGSGKTYSIVKDYLGRSLAAPHSKEYRHILAITFTNKAATEMKSRILRALSGFSSGNMVAADAHLFDELKEELGLSTESLKDRSADLLSSILHDYARFDVGTIDQFTSRLVQTFAQDLDLPAQFEISLDFNALIEEAVHLLLDRVGTDEELTKHLKAYVDEKISDQQNWRIEHDLLNVGQMLGENHHRTALDRLLSKESGFLIDVYSDLQKESKTLEKDIVSTATDVLSLLEKLGFYPKLSRNVGYLFSAFNRFVDFKAYPIEKLVFGATLQDFLARTKGLFPKATTTEQTNLSGVVEEVRDLCSERVPQIMQSIFRYKSIRAVQKPFPGILILKELDEILKTYQSENRLIHISNFNRLIAKEIQDQPIPFIFERLGEKYRHYYLDEFQDTSVLQWENLLPLIENTLASNGSSLLVGDAKQAIYRWRGGKVDQFLELSQGISPVKYRSSVDLSSPFSIEKEKLQYNWRSGSEIVSFVEEFFSIQSELLSTESYKNLFASIGQKAQKSESGYVQIDALKEEDPSDLVLKWIDDLRARNYSYGEITVLVQKHKQGGIIAELLSQKGIPVFSGDSLVLGANAECNALANAIEFLKQGSNAVARCRFLLYLQNRDTPLWEQEELQSAYLNEKKADELLNNTFSELGSFRSLTQKGLYESAEHIQLAFGLGERSPAFIQLFLNTILKVEDSLNIGIAEFTEWWNEQESKLSLDEPEDVDAIRIMTIHKSKGLEFPVVLMPFVNWPYSLDRRDVLWLDLNPEEWYGLDTSFVHASSQMEYLDAPIDHTYLEAAEESILDNLNLLYVAMTRAEKELFLGIPVNKQRKANVGRWFDSFVEKGEILKRGGKDIGKKASNENPSKLQSYVSAPWGSKVRISLGAYQSEAMKRGDLIHQLLSGYISMEALSVRLKELKRTGQINSAEETELYEKIKEYLNTPQFKPFLHSDGQIINERDLISAQGELLRPDRILLNGNSIQVIDFKTGGKENKHVAQLNVYSDVLKDAGFEVNERVLLYLDHKEVISW